MSAQKPVGKTGIVYISRIPPHMKSGKLRHIMSQYGPVKRMYLKNEPMWRYKQRLEKGDRKGRLFEGGWVEFEYKVHAKQCEEQLNGKPINLKGRWQDDIMTLRYLHGFKWKDLENALEEERNKNKTTVSNENEKAKADAKKFLKHTKAIAAGAKEISKEHKKIVNEQDEDDNDGVFIDADQKLSDEDDE